MSRGLQRNSELRRKKPLERKPFQKKPRSAANGTGLKRGTPLKAGKGFSASTAQRKKAKHHDACCLVCGHDNFTATLDPHHLIPRLLGQCQEADCTVVLCRGCHHLIHMGDDDLLAYHERMIPELQHCLAHCDGSPMELARLVSRRPLSQLVGPAPRDEGDE